VLKESTQKKLGKAHGAQGDKQEMTRHLVSKLKLDMMSTKMRKETVVWSLVVKCSQRTKA
jgi:hypothetical protein